jgi:hypothetical protein
MAPLVRRFALGLVVSTGFLSAGVAAPPPKDQPKDVDLVICLDVSGSMNGLIESARTKLWDVVNELARMKPTPNLRVGLYTYGRADLVDKHYVSRDVDLTTDLDEVYKKLNVRPPVGHLEYVTRVTKQALTEQKWSAERNALRVIFVCGNEPENQDKEILPADAARLAKEMHVVVNAIYCGPDSHPEAAGWRDYAKLCGGRYANIDMNRAAAEVAIATPFDKDILAQNEKLNRTYVAYGKDGADKAVNQAVQDANAAGAAGGRNAAAVARAESKAGRLYKNETWDLIDKLKEDPKFDWKKLKEEELCEEFRKIKPEDREGYLKQKSEERAEVQKKIGELSASRQKYIDEERKKQPKSAAEKALDEALQGIIRTQAADVGFETSGKK